MTDIDHS